jgi:hypothetical protein
MYLVESVFHLKDVVPNEVLGHRPAVLISKMAHLGLFEHLAQDLPPQH